MIVFTMVHEPLPNLANGDKIDMIKYVRRIFCCGLTEAKAIVENNYGHERYTTELVQVVKTQVHKLNNQFANWKVELIGTDDCSGNYNGLHDFDIDDCNLDWGSPREDFMDCDSQYHDQPDNCP